MSDAQILDPNAIESLRALSPEMDGSFLRELIEIYLDDTPQRLGELETALAAGDARTMTRAAHTIKGSSSNFGANNLARIALEIELVGKAGNCAPAAAMVPGLKAEYDLVARALKEIAQGS